MSSSLRPCELLHTRLPCPSPTPEVYSNSCPLSQWCHLTISSTVAPLLLSPSLFPSIRIFSNKSALRIRWPEYWSFSFIINPSNEYSGLISFRMDWFDLAVQGMLKSKNSIIQGRMQSTLLIIIIHNYLVSPRVVGEMPYLGLKRKIKTILLSLIQEVISVLRRLYVA